jgi:hypothetical protein
MYIWLLSPETELNHYMRLKEYCIVVAIYILFHMQYIFQGWESHDSFRFKFLGWTFESKYILNFNIMRSETTILSSDH